MSLLLSCTYRTKATDDGILYSLPFLPLPIQYYTHLQSKDSKHTWDESCAKRDYHGGNYHWISNPQYIAFCIYNHLLYMFHSRRFPRRSQQKPVPHLRLIEVSRTNSEHICQCKSQSTRQCILRSLEFSTKKALTKQ